MGDESFKQSSIVMRLDWFEAMDDLPGDEYKACMRAVIDYCRAEVEPANLTPAANMAFRFMKSWLDRDRKRAEEAHEKRVNAGRSGGKSTQAKLAEAGRSNASACQAMPSNSKRLKPNTNTNTYTVEDSAAAQAADPVGAVIFHLNERCGTSYRPSTKDTIRTIEARLREGYSVEDLLSIIDHKADEWMNTGMEKYLRPKTLFAPGNIESYIQEIRKNLTFTENDAAYKVARWIARKNREQNAAFPMPSEKELQKSAAEIEAAIRECMEGGDSRDEAENRISEAAGLAKNNEFWSGTVIDGISLRKHFRQILAQRKEGDT